MFLVSRNWSLFWSCHNVETVTFKFQTTDVLLEELCKSLDEDMNDLDEYEQGLWDPATTE